MPPAGGRGKGDILFRKREYPLWNPKRKAFRLAVADSNDLYASGMRLSARGIVALGVAIRLDVLLSSAAALLIL